MTSWKLHVDGGKQIFSTQAWLRHEFRRFVLSCSYFNQHFSTWPPKLRCFRTSSVTTPSSAAARPAPGRGRCTSWRSEFQGEQRPMWSATAPRLETVGDVSMNVGNPNWLYHIKWRYDELEIWKTHNLLLGFLFWGYVVGYLRLAMIRYRVRF